MDQAFHSRGLAKSYGSRRVQFTWAGAGTPLSYWLLILCVILLYSNAALLVPELEAFQPAQTVAMAGLLALFVERTLSRQGFDLVWPESHLILAFLGAAVLSSLTALWPQYAVEAAINLAKFVAIYFLIVNAVDTRQRLRRIIWVMVLGGLFPAIGAINNYLNGVFLEGGRIGWVGIFANPNELAYSLVILLPPALFLSSKGAVYTRVAAGAIMGLYVTGIFISFSRGAMLAFFTVALLMGLRQAGRSARIATIVLLAAGAVFVGSFWSREEGFTDLSGDATFHQRFATVQAGLAMFADRPLLGVGLNCSILGWPLYAPPGAFSHGWLHNHNTLVQVLSETGLLGFIPFVLLLGSAIYASHKARLSHRQSSVDESARLLTGLEISLWGFIVCGLSGGYALSWFPYLLVALVSASKKIRATDAVESGDS